MIVMFIALNVLLTSYCDSLLGTCTDVFLLKFKECERDEDKIVAEESSFL